jgi:hypothetical protein
MTTFALYTITYKWCVLSGEATNYNFIVFGLTLPGLELMIYWIWSKHINYYSYATDATEIKTHTFLNWRQLVLEMNQAHP